MISKLHYSSIINIEWRENQNKLVFAIWFEHKTKTSLHQKKNVFDMAILISYLRKIIFFDIIEFESKLNIWKKEQQCYPKYMAELKHPKNTSDYLKIMRSSKNVKMVERCHHDAIVTLLKRYHDIKSLNGANITQYYNVYQLFWATYRCLLSQTHWETNIFCLLLIEDLARL